MARIGQPRAGNGVDMDRDRTGHTFHIGQLAAEAGVSTKTIRYYEELGLLPSPARTPSGYRLYTTVERDCLRFIIKAKATGLTLGEIDELLALRRSGQVPCAQLRATLDRKLATVAAQLQALTDFRHELLALRDAAGTGEGSAGEVCGIIERHILRRRGSL